MSTKKIKRLYFDIETSPNIVYSWRVGYNINLDYQNIIKERAIICICYKWEGEDKVHSLRWDNGDDSTMVETFIDTISDADEVIGHNGDAYDLKWFRTRCLYHGVKSLPQFKSIDTLLISRTKFNFNSNRLDYIAQYLGLGAKIKTEFELWKKVMLGDKKALKDMVEYCCKDVTLLEQVFKKLEGYVKPKTHIAVLNGGGKCDCPKCGSTKTHSKGNRISAAGTIQKRMICQGCGFNYQVPMATYVKERK